MWLSNVAERENAPTEYPYEKKSQSEFSQNMTTVTVFPETALGTNERARFAS